MAKKKIEELMYKERPLTRRGNEMFYGFIDDKFLKVYLNDAAVIDVDLPTAETEEYHDMYIAEGDIQLVSWAGDFVISHMELKEIAE